MGKEQIISKGTYSYAQPAGMIGVKQYLFVRESDGKKRLLLRFANNRPEKCSKFAFILYRLDAKGNILGQDKYESADRDFNEREVFSYDRKILVEEKCTDFKVQMVYARYGNYTYNVEHTNVSVAYSEKNLAALSQGKSITKIKPRKINARTFNMPWIFVVLSMIVLALAFAACGFLIKNFKEKEVDFTLGGVSYAFVDKDAKQEVVITGCADTYREITLTGEIEGHRVVGLDEDAFAGNENLVKLTVYDLNIPSEAFENCKSLEAVSLNNITSIGISAFEGCESLETVTVTEGKSGQLLKIGSRAFADCGSLDSVEINQTIVYGSNADYFVKSNNLKSLKLRNFAYTMKNISSAYITKLGVLFGESASKTSSSSKLVNLTVENMDAIPDGFVRGFKSLESVKVNGTEIKSVGKYAFADCEAMTTLETKGQILSIGDYAFLGTDIASFDFTKVKTVGEGVFKDNDKLAEVKGFGAGGFDIIPRNTFAGCKALTSFTIHKNIKHIFSGAFENSGLTKIIIPVGVSFDSGILKGCSKLAELEVYEFGSAGFVGQLFGANKDDSSEKVAGFVPATLTKITLGSGAEINSNAFKGCTNVKVINLPGNISAIGDYAFAGCKNLSVVDIPKDSTMLKIIGKEAFAGCRQLKYVPLLNSLENIGEGALKGCDGLASLELPFLGQTPAFDDESETVSYIFGGAMPASIKELSLLDASLSALPDYTFANCSGVKTITIPGGIDTIGSYAFKGCSALTGVVISGTTNKDGGADMTPIKIIGEYAFSGCASLANIKLGNKLEGISQYAFTDTGITKLMIPDSVDYIGQNIIKGCKKLGSLTVPFLGAMKSVNGSISYFFGEEITESLKTVEVLAFEDNVVGADAFNGCYGITNIEIPSSVTIISEDAFRGCEALGSFDFTNIEIVGDGAFLGCTALKNIDLSNVQVIGESAFGRCTSITKVVLTNALDLDKGAFEECTALTSVTLGDNVGSIGNSAFYGTAITSIKLPEGVNEIANDTFGLCAGLKSVELPSTVTIIGDQAFSGTAITEIEIPAGIEYIGNFAFKDTPIKSLAIPSTAKSVGVSVVAGCTSLESIELPLTVNLYNSGRTVSAYLYDNNPLPQSLKKITINNSSDGYIPSNSFADSLYLEEVIITDGVTRIGEGAFYNCIELRFVSLPQGMEYVGSSAFVNCYRLYEISKPNSCFVDSYYTIQFTDADEGRAPSVEKDGYRLSKFDGSWYLVNYPKVEDVVVPEGFVYDGEVVKEYIVPQYLFYGNTTLKSVKLAGGAVAVGENAFASCENLTSVVLSDSVTVIDNYAFSGCMKLESVQMPKALVSIGDASFYNCELLNNIKLYEKVESIGNDAFLGCSNLFDVYNASKLSLVAGSFDFGGVARRAVKVHTKMDEASSIVEKIEGLGEFRRSGGAWLLIKGYNVEKLNFTSFKKDDATVDSYRIAEGAFVFLDEESIIKEIIIGNEVKQIQRNAFYGSIALVALDGSSNKSLTEIEDGAFENCTALEVVKLPSSVKVIGNSVFSGCFMIKEVTMPTALEVIGENAFNGCFRLISIKLHKNVTEIKSGAFAGCDYLVEVYNLSNFITVNPGDWEHGGVAEKAQAVFTNENDKLERMEENGIYFIKGGNTWYLYDFADKGAEILSIPNRAGSLVLIPYSITNGTFNTIVVPANTVTINTNAISKCPALINIFYSGSNENWYSVGGSDYLQYEFNIFYKADCVHAYDVNVWTDSNGIITTEKCPETSKVETEATCYSNGIMRYTCSCKDCGYTRTEGIEKLPHEFEGDICKHCKETKTSITNSNLKSYVDAGVITIDGFVYNETLKCFESTNKDADSSSSFEIKAGGRMTVRFTAEASSKRNFDFVRIYKEGSSSSYTELSGKDAFDFEFFLEEGDVVLIVYEKDNVGSGNNDCGYIKELQIIEAKQQQSN